MSKLGLLALLTFMSSSLSLLMRHSRTKRRIKYSSSVGICFVDILKLFISLIWFSCSPQPNDTAKIFNICIAAKMSIPSLLYSTQNILLYYGMSRLSALTFQLLLQTKVLFTALFTRLFLKKALSPKRWFALISLSIGVVLVQLDHSKSGEAPYSQVEWVKGCLALIFAAISSSFASCYFEIIAKSSSKQKIPLSLQNVYLSLLGFLFAFVISLMTDPDFASKIKHDGLGSSLFIGFDYFNIFVLTLHALTSILIGIVIRYCDNLIKGLVSSLSLLISTFGASYLYGESVSYQQAIGSFIVVISIFTYLTDEEKAALKEKKA